jgi:serine/threonine protein phosphatase PrpC/CRP-like cAMP-binding protein
MKLKVTAGTDVGKERDNNEDAFIVDDELSLYVVCDGMGGHQAGEVASNNAVEFIREGVRDRRGDLTRFLAGEMTTKEVRAILRNVMVQANFKLREMAISDPSLDGMGTTSVALMVLGHHGFLAHVGDSRIYLFRGDTVHLLTEDHSIGSEIQKPNSLPQKFRSALTRALGVYDNVVPDVLSLDLFPGDSLLLASDGLYSYYSARKLHEQVSEVGPEDTDKCLKRLIKGALDKGGRDNVTGIYLYVEDDPAKKEYQIARKKLEIIQQLNLFRYLSFVELLHLLNIARAEKFSAGAPVFKEGDEGESLYVILRGAMQVVKGSTELAELTDGMHFGEMALVDKSPRSATVTAARDSVCLVIDRADFYDLLRDLPNLAVKVLWCFVRVLSRRLRETSDELSITRGLLREKAGEHGLLLEVGAEDAVLEPPPLPEPAVSPSEEEDKA